MLPFLKHSKEASASLPVESLERKPDNESNEFDELEVAAQDMLAAIEAKDSNKLASALRAAFDLLDQDQE